ncbi:MAG TPA: AmmeMemoRadiSam system protein A [Vicinamibacterales bacterium]|jgi:AmmeMemoRadiSam system protein A
MLEPLSPAERALLLRVAREAIAANLAIGASACVTDAEGLLRDRQAGAFVTIRCGGELRGCIGDLDGGPILEVVRHCAVAAASSDPRFSRVTAAEWPAVDLEISVLGALEPVDEVTTIEIGRHGLIVEHGRRRGLLLPQVATEWGWDRETFLAHTCRKAGLPPDAWRKGAQVFRFEADVFADEWSGTRNDQLP